MGTVGVIGLGKMGLPIAANLIERGFRVTGYDPANLFRMNYNVPPSP